MRTAGILAAFLVLALLAAVLFVRSRLTLESRELVLQPAGGLARRVPLDNSASPEAARDRIELAMIDALQAAPDRDLKITLILRVERRAFRFGLPPWSKVSDAQLPLDYALSLRPGPSPQWVPMIGGALLAPVGLDAAREALLEAMTEELRRFDDLRRAFP